MELTRPSRIAKTGETQVMLQKNECKEQKNVLDCDAGQNTMQSSVSDLNCDSFSKLTMCIEDIVLKSQL